MDVVCIKQYLVFCVMSFIPVGPASRRSSLIYKIIPMFYNSYCLVKCKKDRRDAGPTKTSQANRFLGLTNDSGLSMNFGGNTGRRIWPDAELRRYKGLFRSTGRNNPDQTIGCSANDAHNGVGAEKVTITLTCTGAYGHGFLQAIRLVNFIKLVRGSTTVLA